MRFFKLLSLVLCLVLIADQSAWAHPPRSRVGVFIGPAWGPFWYPGPWPQYPPPIIVNQPAPPPPVYVEQGSPAASVSDGEYWYYCEAERGYYPTVAECAEGWVAVLPQSKK